eukprot:3158248-Alexandrium_andersonii.AAC.1
MFVYARVSRSIASVVVGIGCVRGSWPGPPRPRAGQARSWLLIGSRCRCELAALSRVRSSTCFCGALSSTLLRKREVSSSSMRRRRRGRFPGRVLERRHGGESVEVSAVVARAGVVGAAVFG